MISIRKLLPVFLFCWAGSAFGALGAWVPVDLGAEMVGIPVPDGYRPITPEMGATYKHQSTQVPANTVLLDVLIRDEDAEQAIREPRVPLVGIRSIAIQASMSAIGRKVTQDDLRAVQRIVVEKNSAKIENLQERSKLLLGRILSLSEKYGGDTRFGLSLSSMLPLPVNDESPSHFTVSLLTRGKMTMPDGTEVEAASAATATTMIVRDRMLMIFMAGKADEVELQRATHKNLVRDILNFDFNR